MTTPEWLDGQVDRVLTDQRARAETAKLAVTFAVGVNAAVLAAALQVGYKRDLLPAVIVAGVAAVGAVLVFLSDGLKMPDHDGVLRRTRGNDDARVRALRRAALVAVNANNAILRIMRAALVVAAIAAVASSVLTVLWFVAHGKA